MRRWQEATRREYGPGVIRVEPVNYTPRHGPKGGRQDPQVLAALAARANADRQRRWRERNRPRKDAKHPWQAVMSDAQLEAVFMLPSSGFAWPPALRLFQGGLSNKSPRFGAAEEEEEE